METFSEQINTYDMLQFAINYRPESSWIVQHICATTFFATPLSDFPIGCCRKRLPQALKYLRGVNLLTRDHNQNKYKDQLCFFRALALGKGTPVEALTPAAIKYAKEFGKNSVTLSDLPKLESRFKVNINVFEYDFVNKCLSPQIRTCQVYKTTLNLLLYQNHFAYIKNMDKATKSYSCQKCGRLWHHIGMLHRHEKICTGAKPNFITPGASTIRLTQNLKFWQIMALI